MPNIYSLLLIIVYLTLVTIMGLFSAAVHLEAFFITFPLIFSLIIWSYWVAPILKKSDGTLSKEDLFKQDLFIITFSFILTEQINLLVQYNNSDVLGWWPLILYFMFAEGFIFALLFSIIALMLHEHKKYTFGVASILAVFLFATDKLFYLYPKSFFATSGFYYGILIIILGIHLVICMGYKATMVKLR